MFRSKLIFRYLVFGVLIACTFLLLTQLTAHWLQDYSQKERRRLTQGPFLLVSTLLEGVPAEERVSLLEKVKDKNPRDFVVNAMFLLDENREILYPQDRKGDKYKSSEQDIISEVQGEPKQYLVQVFSLAQKEASARRRPMPPMPQGFGDKGMRGPPPDMMGDFPPPPSASGVAEMRGKLPPPPPQGFGPPPKMEEPRPMPFTGIYIIQIVALFGAVLITVLGLVWSLRAKAKLAEDVISDMRKGNLKARFPISQSDEVGQIMISFNKMADEIEYLVESLRKTETSRRDLLRELAHDLRTPIASMRTLLETIYENQDRLSPEKMKEILKTALQEINYFSNLVDDLLFLGRVEEPGYRVSHESCDLSELIRDEVSAVSGRIAGVECRFDIPEVVSFKGDAQLLKRLLRNGLENAISYARSEVKVSLKEQDHKLYLTIEDDGAGFSDNALKSFGHKKFSREFFNEGSKGKRISIGLGSVIMKSIVDVHRGSIVAENHRIDGKVAGARISMVFPLIENNEV